MKSSLESPLTTSPSLFLFVTGCIVASALLLFGLSMLARRASSVWAYIAGALSLLPVAGCVRSYNNNATILRSMALEWGAVLLAIPFILYIQARSLGLSPAATLAGFLGDLGLSILWLILVAFVEMFATADGGPGIGQYALVFLLTFFGVELLLPPIIAKAMPKRASLPPRVARPGEYPRP